MHNVILFCNARAQQLCSLRLTATHYFDFIDIALSELTHSQSKRTYTAEERRERGRANGILKGEHKSHVHSIILAFVLSVYYFGIIAPFPLFMRIALVHFDCMSHISKTVHGYTFFSCVSTLLSIVHLMIAFLHQGKFCYIMLALWFHFVVDVVQGFWWYVKTLSYFVPGQLAVSICHFWFSFHSILERKGDFFLNVKIGACRIFSKIRNKSRYFSLSGVIAWMAILHFNISWNSMENSQKIQIILVYPWKTRYWNILCS